MEQAPGLKGDGRPFSISHRMSISSVLQDVSQKEWRYASKSGGSVTKGTRTRRNVEWRYASKSGGSVTDVRWWRRSRVWRFASKSGGSVTNSGVGRTESAWRYA